MKLDGSGLELTVFDAKPPASIMGTVEPDGNSSLSEMKHLLFGSETERSFQDVWLGTKDVETRMTNVYLNDRVPG